MDWLQYQDLISFLVFPIIVITIWEVRKNWNSLWDNDLTTNDRQLLMKIALFLLMPIVVMCHELGHAIAIIALGGHIAEFHYGLLWGYVVPSGFFSPEQIITIYLAGNIVQILIGLLSLILTVFVNSPPLVALLVYIGLWSVSGTAVIYTLMSFASMYGDWQAIYSSPLHSWTEKIAMCHIILVALLLWLIYGKQPRLWFNHRTSPTKEQ